MDGEFISTAYTYNQGRIAINNAFSGTAVFNGIALKLVTTGNTYTVQDGVSVVIQTGTANIYLPESHSENRIIIAKNYGAGSVDVIPFAGGSIDGSSTGVTLTPLQSITVQANGLQWYIINYFA